MKIVYVSDAIYPYNKGGKEKRLYEISTRLAKQGHDVHIYTMHWWSSPSKVIIEDGVTLHAISKLYDMYNGDRRSIKEGLLFGLACLKLIRVKFDILDVDHMPFFPILSAWVVCLLTFRRRKFYGIWHEALSVSDWTDYMGKSGYVAAWIEKISTKLPYRISAASALTVRQLDEYHKRSKRVALVANGIDTKLINKVRPADTVCDVLYVGRLVKDKNIDKLVQAIALVAKQKPDVTCVIIGHGIEKSSIKRFVHKLHLENNVSILEPLPNAEDVYAFMKAATVFVLPSIREGFGIVALEALACNTPVITVDAPANAAKELISNREMGSVVQLDVNALAASIQERVEQGTKFDIAKFVAEFDWNKLASKQGEVYAI